ncbi:MAG: polyamine aminopropyltransferase [Pseudomonadota bacterium]
MKGQERFDENVGENLTIQYHLRGRLFSGRSEFQHIDILETEEYGRMLLLDGVANSSERDEYIYHEALVHPALLTHPHPRTVCVIGGGEGATLREIFRHPGVSRVVMVDIDRRLVELCRQHLPNFSAGAFEDPRLELFFGDGRRFLEETEEEFDVILVDLSDPVPDSPAVYLFTKDFYKVVFDRLSPDGVACFQGESLQPWRCELHARMFNTLAEIFPVTLPYPYMLPCFHELHSMILASKRFDPRETDLAGRIKERGLDLKFLSPNFFKGLFHVPAWVEKAYADHSEILTDEKPYILTGYSAG